MSKKQKTISEKEDNFGFDVRYSTEPEVPTENNVGFFKRTQVRILKKYFLIKNKIFKSEDIKSISFVIRDVLLSGLFLNTGLIIFGVPFNIINILSLGCFFYFFSEKIYSKLLELVDKFSLSKHYK